MTPNERTHADRPSDASIARVFFAMYEEINLAGIDADAFAKVAIGKARELDTAKPAQVADTQAECTTCGGSGSIDERLGGYSFSNPAATCPDCDGEGYWTRTHADENAASAPTDRGIALAIDWARSNAGEHAAVIENALAAYDPERVGARTVAKPAQGAEDGDWPEYLMIRDTKLHDDIGGGGQRIYTTAGAGYTKRKYVREDLAAQSPQRRPITDYMKD